MMDWYVLPERHGFKLKRLNDVFVSYIGDYLWIIVMFEL